MRLWCLPRYMVQFLCGATLKLWSRRCGKMPLAGWPLEWYGIRRFELGDSVNIGHRSWLAVCDVGACEDPGLSIGDRTRLGNYNHIFAVGRITIGKDVLTADRVYIADNTHGYADPETPVMRQEVRMLGETSIGDGSWLGENVCVFGAKIGRHCVIGANSVVNRDIPDHCVAAGVPAKIIRRYDPAERVWKRVTE